MNSLEDEAELEPVNGFFDLNRRKLREQDGQFITTRLRLSGYLRGIFSQGADYTIWSHEKFSRGTRSHKHLTPKHIARVWGVFRKTTPHWRFEKIRLGRSFRWKVTPASASSPTLPKKTTNREIESRLMGYIRGAARKEGRVVIAEPFLLEFCKTSRIPPHRARSVLQKIRKIPGLHVSERKAGLRVSLPHFPRGLSSPFGREEINTQTTRARCAPNFAGENTAALGPPHESASVANLTPRSNTASVAKFTLSAKGVGASLRSPALRRAVTGAFAFKGVWFSERKLLGLACHLAKSPMREKHHDGQLVRWRFAHARNFAFRALKRGFASDRIVTAWESGILKSHADARDKNESSPREPSAVVVYAWRFLEDGKTPEARWETFLATDPSNREVRRVSAALAVKPRVRRSLQSERAVVNTSEHPVKMSGLSIDSLSADSVQTYTPHRSGLSVEEREAKLVAYLTQKGITLGQFGGFSFGVQGKLIRASEGKNAKPSASESFINKNPF